MNSDAPASTRFEVLLAGGGVAAVEAALALRDLAGERVSITMLAPNDELVYRPMTVREPFAYRVAERYSLERIANDLGLRLLKDSFVSVDPSARLVNSAAGEQPHYDALLLCMGARIRARYQHAITIDDRRLDELLHGLIQDIEGGYVHKLAFVVPPRMAWPFPLYELALMSARRAYDAGIEITITLLTPEQAPLALFGKPTSRSLVQLLEENRIDVVAPARCEVPEAGRIVIKPDRRALAEDHPGTRPGQRELSVDRIVALPELEGPAVGVLPSAPHGFIPVDRHCQVRGVDRVYAAGDATNFPVKLGGIAAQQADAAAASIAALAGAPALPTPFRPVIQGILLTGSQPRYLSAHLTGGHAFSSTFTERATWSPPTKIAAQYLAPYLEGLDRISQR
jgi:sulfide:quinone oxidoreductase